MYYLFNFHDAHVGCRCCLLKGLDYTLASSSFQEWCRVCDLQSWKEKCKATSSMAHTGVEIESAYKEILSKVKTISIIVAIIGTREHQGKLIRALVTESTQNTFLFPCLWPFSPTCRVTLNNSACFLPTPPPVNNYLRNAYAMWYSYQKVLLPEDTHTKQYEKILF